MFCVIVLLDRHRYIGECSMMNTDIRVITSWTEINDKFYAPGALVEVINGKGIIHEEFYELMDDKSYCALMMGDTPLFQFQGDEYYCPTCEKIMKSGYNLEQSEEFYNQVINATKEDVSFEAALESIKPLLGLLESKYYIVLDTSLYPTDGNGHLFWEIPNENKEMPGTCIYYFREKGLTWGQLKPYFTAGTQPVNKLSEERVNYYYNKNGSSRAIAYYMDGYMTALLDGHHKAMAAALKGEKMNALVIISCFNSIKNMGEKKYDIVGMGSMEFPCNEYGLKTEKSTVQNKISKEQQWQKVKKILQQIPQAPLIHNLPYNTIELAKQYPDIRTMAYTDLVGEITKERIEQILTEKENLLPDQAIDFLEAIGGLRHESLREIADLFFYKYQKISNVVITCFKVLTKLPHTDELDSYLIDKMVEFEDEYPTVKDYVMEYF